MTFAQEEQTRQEASAPVLGASADGPAAAGKIERGAGITPAEQYLKRLCDHTFLSLWSYSGLYRDQGRHAGKGDGKELCDLLVVFGNDIIIFSDKHCAFKNTGDLELDWKRWFKKAVEASAEQIWGAERWIKEHRDKIFLDRSCTRPFPLALPDPSAATFHRVVVAHGVSPRCREELGGSGSLMIAPSVIGKMHYGEGIDRVPAFMVGQLDPARGYVHILDDTSLHVLLTTLDTITDFVAYLRRKERCILGGRLAWAAGEDDLLGYYLRDINEQGEHDFVIPAGFDAITVHEGQWQQFASSAERRSQVAADKVSYLWDRLIERFNVHILEGTQYWASHPSVADQEPGMRLLASEPRFQRRLLAGALLDMAKTTPKSMRRTRVLPPTRPGQPYFVFLLLPHFPGVPDDEYREARRNFLLACCRVTKLRFPEARDIVGIATESGIGGPDDQRSEDAMYYDGRLWDDAERAEAERLQRVCGILTNVTTMRTTESEYPAARAFVPRTDGRVSTTMKGRDRNVPCPCGSGKKYKRCCG